MTPLRRFAPFLALAVALLLAVVVPERERAEVSATTDASTPAVVEVEAVEAEPVATTVPTTIAVAPLAAMPVAPVRTRPIVAVAAAPVVAAPVTTTTTFAVAPRVPTPLAVAASGWASLRSGTPGDAEVPEGGLPVGSAAGNDDKRSFVRLVGDETVLRLPVDATGSTSPEDGAIRACRIVDDWEPATGMTFDQAPAHDDAQCVDGVVDAGGTAWSFDLAAFADRTDDRGFALLPVPGSALATFQITLRTS